MYDTRKQAALSQTTETQCGLPGAQHTQEAGNQAVLDQMGATDATFGFLDGFLGDVAAPSMTDWSAPLIDDAKDQGLGDSLDLDVTLGGRDIDVGLSGVQVAADATLDESSNALLGGSQTALHARGGVTPDGVASVGTGTSYEAFDGDFKAQGGATIGTDGTMAANGSVAVADVELSAAGQLKVGQNGVEHVAMQGGAKVGGNGASVGFFVQPRSVALDGNTVVWESSAGANGSVEAQGVGLGGESASGTRESRTFPDARTARAYADALRSGAVTQGSTREITAAQAAVMQEGEVFTHATQSRQAGKLLVVDGQQTTVDGIQVRKGRGQTVHVDLVSQQSSDAQTGAENGLMGAEFVFAGKQAKTELSATLDLSDPVQAEVFDTFQETGELPPEYLTRREQVAGTHDARSATLPGFSVRQETMQEEGTRMEGGVEQEVVRSSEMTGVTDLGWSMLPYAAEHAIDGLDWLANIVPHGKDTGWHRLADTCERTGDAWYEQGLEEGSQSGEERHQLDVYVPREGTEAEKRTSMTMRQYQVMDFDDRQQTARALHDATELDTDREGIDPAGLPAAGTSNRVWTMESIIDEEGTAKVLDELASEKGVGYEWQAAREVEWVRDTYFRGNDDMTAMHGARAMAALARYGGEDAAEGMRKAAGDEHVERFLQLEGDDTWVGRRGNTNLDRKAHEAARDGNTALLQDILESELDRLRRVREGRDFTEVPDSLRTEEANRIEARIAEIRGNL